MTSLSVNINKVATLRNARGGDVPNVVEAAMACERFGADGVTVHPRPDERHIRYQDVRDIKGVLRGELNIEGFPSERFVDLVLEVRPAQVTLVPDAPDVLTSCAGWDCVKHEGLLRELTEVFHKHGVRVSIFVEADTAQVKAAAKTGADRVELFTGPYAHVYGEDRLRAVAPYVEAAEVAHGMGLGVNAGHDLCLENLEFFHKHVKWLDEVSIGHALISDALYVGLEKAVKDYKGCLV